MKNINRNFLSLESARSGFTLIELIIVMGIMVIVISISIGSLTRSQDQQIFNNNFEKLYSLINTARSLAISGKGQLDYTDFDHDGCKDSGAAPQGATCEIPDYVTPANYGIHFDSVSAPNVVLFADMNPPAGDTATGQKGVYNSGTNYGGGEDLDLDSLTLSSDVTLEIIGATTGSDVGAIFFSPNYADITFDPAGLNTEEVPSLILKLKQGEAYCKQIRIHRLAGIPEVELCTVSN